MATYGPEEFKTRSGRTVILRHCDVADIDAFLAFQPQIASETTNTLQIKGRVPERLKIEAAWRSSIEDHRALRIAAFSDNRMIAQLSFHPESQLPHPWIQHTGRFGMMILKEFWGEGIGRRMLEVMEIHARAQGFTRIEAMVRTENERGVRLYRRMGYEIEGTRRQGALIDGRFQDEYFIAKILGQETWVPPVLETERLVLRPLEIGDVADIFEYASNPNVSRFTLWEPHRSIKDSESYILDYVLPYYRQHTPEPWGITLKANPGKVIGTVGLFWASKTSKSMELAYAIGEPHWGQGIVVEASRAAVSHGFRDFGAARIQAHCKAENKPSARVMEKLGMKFEGTLRSALFHRNRHWDMHFYSVLREEWS